MMNPGVVAEQCQKTVEEELNEKLGDIHDPTFADLIRRTIVELTYLRSLAGAVSRGASHADLKRQHPVFD